MNLVKDILDQCTGNLGALGSLLGADEDTTEYAASAAVPALLSGLASVASRDDGASKVASALNGLGSTSMDDVLGMLRGDADTVAARGTSLLGTLFGDNMVTNLVGALSKYAGLGGGAVKKLLALLAPMVLGKVASAWKSRGGTQQALTGLLAEQRPYIAEAMPADFSLADVPGWSAAKSAAGATGRRAAPTADTATRSVAAWAVPLALALLIGFLLWNFMRQRPGADAAADRADNPAQEVTAMKPVTPAPAVTADVTRINDDLRSIFASTGDVFADIKDAASAEAARPKLEELSTRIDGVKKLLAQMPAAAKASVRTTAEKPIEEIRQQATWTLETPGLAAEIRSLITGILEKLAKLFA